jgi:hypothetical protein
VGGSGRAASLGSVLPGDALRDDASRAGRARGGDQIASALTSHPAVPVAEPREVRRSVGQVGQLMNNDVRSESGDRHGERARVVHVADDGLGSEFAQHPGFCW